MCFYWWFSLETYVIGLLAIDASLVDVFLFAALFLFFTHGITGGINLISGPGFHGHRRKLVPLIKKVSICTKVYFAFKVISCCVPRTSLCLTYTNILIFVNTLSSHFSVDMGVHTAVRTTINVIVVIFNGLCLDDLNCVFNS